MNFLAHLLLAGDDDGLRLGAMLGDFIRGNPENTSLPATARTGVLLHRFIDQYIDSLHGWTRLREQFPATFRRYSGIIIDLAFDHELALRWCEFSTVPLEQFDREIRALLLRHSAVVPEELWRFMHYADKRGLFASYRSEAEILFSLEGIGRRLSRPNPLHQVAEIWHEMKPEFSLGFRQVFPQVQAAVADWLLEPRALASGR